MQFDALAMNLQVSEADATDIFGAQFPARLNAPLINMRGRGRPGATSVGFGHSIGTDKDGPHIMDVCRQMIRRPPQ